MGKRRPHRALRRKRGSAAAVYDPSCGFSRRSQLRSAFPLGIAILTPGCSRSLVGKLWGSVLEKMGCAHDTAARRMERFLQRTTLRLAKKEGQSQRRPSYRGCQRMPSPEPSPRNRMRRLTWLRLRLLIVSCKRRRRSCSDPCGKGSSTRAAQCSSWNAAMIVSCIGARQRNSLTTKLRKQSCRRRSSHTGAVRSAVGWKRSTCPGVSMAERSKLA